MPPNQPPPARKRPTTSQPSVPRTSGPRPSVSRAPAEAKLVCTAGPKAGTEFPLAGTDDVVIGRATDNAISIPDTSVSRKHVLLRHLPQGWAVSDMGSGNGTLLNGERIAEETVLGNQDVITLGDTEFQFVMVGDTSPRAAPPPRRSLPPGASGMRPRPSMVGRPDVRSRLARGGAPSDPDAQARKKKMLIIGGAVFAVVLIGLGGVKAMKLKQEAREAQRMAALQAARAQYAELFQDGRNLVRQGNWKDAKTKFQELYAVAPNYPDLQNYLDRADKEIPNQQYLAQAEAALRDNKVGAAAAALAKVSPDTVQGDRQGSLQAALDDKITAQMNAAQAAMSQQQYQSAADITDDILKAQPNNRDAKVINDQAKQTIAQEASKCHADSDCPGSTCERSTGHCRAIVAAKPWEAGVERFIGGDLPGALAIEDDCAAKRITKCKQIANEMREFGDLNKRMDDLDDRGLNRIHVLEKEITGGRHSVLTRNSGIKLGNMYMKKASNAFASGNFAKAGELSAKALAADPNNNGAQSLLSQMRTKAHDMYMQAYSLKDTDPDSACDKFRQVIQMTSEDNEDHQKAQTRAHELCH